MQVYLNQGNAMSEKELDLTGVTSEPENPSAESASAPQGRCRVRISRLRSVFGMLLLALLVSTLMWRAYSTADYWQAAWNGGSLFPGESSDGTLLAQIGAQRPRGSDFDLSEATVPARNFKRGGPPKDGIPAITNPALIPANQVNYLQADDRLIGVLVGNEARAYPLKILNYHEIVNDRIDDSPFAVTYCPLCDSAAVFDRRTPLGVKEFGVSGLLYNSNVLMFDRGGKPESLWSQIMTEGVSGPTARNKLKALPLELTTWQDWRDRYPNTKVLSAQTGHARDYGRNPYAGYFQQPGLMFPVQPTSDLLPTKSRVLGVWTKQSARAYPESAFSAERTRIEETIDGKKVVIQFNPESKSLRVVESDEDIQWMYSLWFAWYAFNPETTIFE